MPNRMEQTALLRPAPSRTGLWIGLAALVLVLAAAIGAFLLWPRSGKVIVQVADPGGASLQKVEILVDGAKRCDTAPCIVEPLPSGTHIVKVSAVGYDQASAQTVTVVSGKEASVSFTLIGTAPKKTGTGIRVSGKQVGVKLFVDGDEKGPLPQEISDLSPGNHVIKIAGSDRYAAMEKKIIVAKDEMQDLGDVTLKVVKGKATISLLTAGARVFLVTGADRRELLTLPIAVDIDTSKSWSLEASKTLYDDYKKDINFDDGQAEKTFDILLGLHGAPPPIPTTTASIPPTATTAPTSTTAPSATTAPAATGEAFLNINSIPPSSCFLDGRPLGMTPQHVSVSPGGHQVKFVNSELGLTKTISVSVNAGQTKLAAAKLN